MEWIIRELKPHIDYHYRTWPQREATRITGSSMGGLMAMYGVVHHNDVFSKAACLSPSVMICIERLSDELFYNDINPDTRIYWSFGSKELSAKKPDPLRKSASGFSGNARISRRTGKCQYR